MKNDNSEKIEKLSNLLEVEYSRSKEDIWSAMEDKLSAPKKEEKKVIQLNLRNWTVAASVIILLGIGSFIRFYHEDYSTMAGEQYRIELPDGSMVDLNGQSSLQFHPYWWKINRSLNFEGEGYFEVEKGKSFSVVSTNGTTTVLGTSFNIYSRDANYEVNCLTGKVKVKLPGGAQTVITPNQQAKLVNNQLEVTETNASHSTEWKDNEFYFTRETIKRVFREIEIAYNAKISVEADETTFYSGNFKKTDNIEDALTIVCNPLNLKFVQLETGTYVIKSN